jgi:oxygen-independent coproporphyrinogen III oxidase
LSELRSDHMGFNAAMIRKYDHAGPRYTSYPTANLFSEEFTANDYTRHAVASNGHLVPRRLSLYFHIPFCDTLCFYCACNKIVTKNRGLAVEYLKYLSREIRLQGELFDSDREAVQIHLGGGTPTFLGTDQIAELLAVAGRYFSLSTDEDREFSIEIDPRGVSERHLSDLRDSGFNRISLGVQDFNPDVQKAVHRIQSPELTMDLIRQARRLGFRSTNVDLIYGLPLQTHTTFKETLERLLEVEPERLSIFNYAHLPQLFYPQRRIQESDLPRPDEKLRILETTISILDDAGYVYIGMDHFAKPGDSLAKAQNNGTLYRNFQGYSTFSDCDLIGLGVSSIGQVDLCYSQNHKTLDSYYAALDSQQLPVHRGLEMNRDDLIRRHVIERLTCYYGIDLDSVCASAGLKFEDYFGLEWSSLREFEQDGLVKLDQRHHNVDITPTGRFLMRNICMTFDQYLRSPERKGTYSRVI